MSDGDAGVARAQPLSAGSFDRILSTLFFDHLTGDDKRACLAEIRRVLRPGGELYVADCVAATARRKRLDRNLRDRIAWSARGSERWLRAYLAQLLHGCRKAMDSITIKGDLEALVIGGGQAGLAVGHQLAERGVPFLIVDANSEVGAVWRSRWDSLRLFTSSRYNDLPGMAFPGTPGAYPGKDEVADFLHTYARRFHLPVQLNTKVTSLAREDGVYVARSVDDEIRARQVVVATGPFHVPFIPRIADQLDPQLPQIHSADYRSPEGLPAGKALVVGAANSGQQIALELSKSRPVDIAVGERMKTLPQRPLGRDIWWWLSLVRLPKITVGSRLGRRLSQRDVVIGGGLRELERSGVTVRPRVAGGSGRTVNFDDGSSADYEAIVWATGFRVDHSWIEIPELKDQQGRIRHLRGVTDSPGLYLLGMTWQHTRTSALLGWVGIDAAYLADRIEATGQTPDRRGELAATTS